MSLSVYLMALKPTTVFEWNITHNLGAMAQLAGLYKALWRPDELMLTEARDLIPLLKDGLDRLRADPAKFKALNPPNRWGSYEGLVEFVEKYLEACEADPDAKIEVCR